MVRGTLRNRRRTQWGHERVHRSLGMDRFAFRFARRAYLDRHFEPHTSATKHRDRECTNPVVDVRARAIQRCGNGCDDAKFKPRALSMTVCSPPPLLFVHVTGVTTFATEILHHHRIKKEPKRSPRAGVAENANDGKAPARHQDGTDQHPSCAPRPKPPGDCTGRTRDVGFIEGIGNLGKCRG